MTKCGFCGEDVKPGQKICFACGSDLREKPTPPTVARVDRRRIIWGVVAMIVAAVALIAARSVRRAAPPEPKAAVHAKARHGLAATADDEETSKETQPILPGSAILVAEYQATADFLLERVDRVRQKLADANQLGSEDSVALNQVRAQLEEVLRQTRALAGAQTQESRDNTRAALENRLADIRDQLDDLEQ